MIKVKINNDGYSCKDEYGFVYRVLYPECTCVNVMDKNKCRINCKIKKRTDHDAYAEIIEDGLVRLVSSL